MEFSFANDAPDLSILKIAQNTLGMSAFCLVKIYYADDLITVMYIMGIAQSTSRSQLGTCIRTLPLSSNTFDWPVTVVLRTLLESLQTT